MELAVFAKPQVVPYEIVEMILKHFHPESLKKLFIQSTKFNPQFAEHVKVVLIKIEKPVRHYIYTIYNNISTIDTMYKYLNTVSQLHMLKVIDNKEKENAIFKNMLAHKIENPRHRKKFENLTKCVGKYCE